MVRGCSDGKQKRVKEASRLQLSNRRKHVYLLPSIHVVARSKHTLLCNWKISFATEQKKRRKKKEKIESVQYDVRHDLHLFPTSLLIPVFEKLGFCQHGYLLTSMTPPPHPSYPFTHPTPATPDPTLPSKRAAPHLAVTVSQNGWRAD